MEPNYADIVKEMQDTRVRKQLADAQEKSRQREEVRQYRLKMLAPLLRVLRSFKNNSLYHVFNAECYILDSGPTYPNIRPADLFYAKERNTMVIRDYEDTVKLVWISCNSQPDCNDAIRVSHTYDAKEIDKLIPLMLDSIADMGLHR